MPLDFVVHGPVPYRHRSGGYRALYRLAHELDQRGHHAFIWPLPEHGFLEEINDPFPFNVRTAFPILDQTPLWHESIHIIPEGIRESPADKTVRWILDREVYDPRDDLVVDWFGVAGPRLCVEIIERDIFYPKPDELVGSGLLVYFGKGGKNRDPDWMPGPEETEITLEWPNSRADLAELLRGAAGLITADNNCALVFESCLCGTPVWCRGFEPYRMHNVFGLMPGVFVGREWALDDWISVQVAVQEAPAHYDKVCKEIAGDVDNLIKLCEDKWQ